jgi:hypothetical protein
VSMERSRGAGMQLNIGWHPSRSAVHRRRLDEFW